MPTLWSAASSGYPGSSSSVVLGGDQLPWRHPGIHLYIHLYGTERGFHDLIDALRSFEGVTIELRVQRMGAPPLGQALRSYCAQRASEQPLQRRFPSLDKHAAYSRRFQRYRDYES